MELIPSQIYEDFISNKKDKNETINLLITLIENVDDDTIRNECINVLNKLDPVDIKVFKVLEDLLISEINQNIRHSAAQVIKDKFIKKSLDPFIWILQHESSYDVLITVLKSLEELGDFKAVSILREEIKKISSEELWNDIFPSLTQEINEQALPSKLTEMLINLITLDHLKNKFHKIKFKIENGIITELDFSNVDNQVISWHDRESLQDYSGIIGIKNLRYLKILKFFSEKWVLKNEFSFNCSIALIDALERLNNNIAKNTLITQLNNISDKKFSLSLNELLNFHQKIDILSLSKLSDIYTNYLALKFLKNKYPSIDYDLNNGEIISIHIENEPLTTVPYFIKHFQSLRSLILKGCRLYILPESIGSFKCLIHLDLQNNNLKTIPKSISNLSSLKVLNLSNNKIQKLPYSIGNLLSLQKLNLDNNNLTEFPSSIGNLTLLEELTANKNILKKIPSSIGALKSLKSLILNYNKIGELPCSIGLLYSLAIFHIDNNYLERIPNSINSISSLKSLSLEENEIKKLPKSIGLLRSLEYLRLGWNKIEKLPKSIGSLVSLKFLRLNNNKIQNFSNSLCFATSIEFMDFSYNKIEILPEYVEQLKSLKILKLKHNKLEKIPNSIGSLFLLEKLDLSENNISHLPESMKELSNLQEIWLNGNKLQDLPSLIENLKLFKKQDLYDNQSISLNKSVLKNI